jgi:hypothetical protein
MKTKGNIKACYAENGFSYVVHDVMLRLVPLGASPSLSSFLSNLHVVLLHLTIPYLSLMSHPFFSEG